MAARVSVATFARCSRTQSPYARTTSFLQASRARPASQCATLASSVVRYFAVSCAAQEKKYTKDHEWVELDSDGKSATIGISVYAAKALGDVVFVELPTPDTQVSAHDTVGAVESVKSASDIMTPVSGTITEVNSLLEEKPGTINKGPEGEGWIFKIEVGDKAEVEELMDVEAYRAFTEE